MSGGGLPLIGAAAFRPRNVGAPILFEAGLFIRARFLVEEKLRPFCDRSER